MQSTNLQKEPIESSSLYIIYS